MDRELTRLLRRDHHLDHLDAEVVHAFDLLRTSRGRVQARDLVRATGWSQRRLSGRFGATLGLPPKRMARLTRMEHTLELLTRPGLGARMWRPLRRPPGSTTRRHLTNEVRQYTGLSPTTLLARRLPDTGGVFDLDAA
jgi:methylphosphotriester-DNA--protein-cysteine methyltransferase